MVENAQSLCGMSLDELRELCREIGARPFRAKQIRHWIFDKRAESFDDMTDLPAGLRERLRAGTVVAGQSKPEAPAKGELQSPSLALQASIRRSPCRLFPGEIVGRQIAKDRTQKLLLRLPDGEHIECVLMRETRRRTACISTQVGCAMGCVFCASGMLGVKRNLTTAEILEQVLRVDRLLKPHERLTNLVVMGIGEPLANLKSLLPALDAVCGDDGLGLSPRRVTVSTVGLPDAMRELAAVGKPFNLAVSLHAPNDELRTRLVPVNRNIGIAAILAAADDYFRATGRRVTYEYVLLGNVNDSVPTARELAGLLRGRNAHVNLIPMNAVSELPFENPSLPRTEQFVRTLTEAGVNATVRKRKGADIDAACGQLRLHAERGGATVVLT